MHLSGDRWQIKKKKERESSVPPPRPPSTPAPRRGGGDGYKVILSAEAQAQYDDLAANIKRAVGERLDRLKYWPEVSGVGPMWGEAQGKHRIKFWDWRVIFEVSDQTNTITVEKIEHRSTSYGEFH